MAIHLHCHASESEFLSSPRSRERDAMPDSRTEFELATLGVALEGVPGGSYDEEAFHHLVAIECKRTERSNRPFLLLLLDLQKQFGADADIAPAVAIHLFAGLARCLLETDFMGWY